MKKRYRATSARKAILANSVDVCSHKRRYEDIADAWDMSVLRFITLGWLHTPYKCAVCSTYHLTSHAGLGDLSHLPPHLRELFGSPNNEVQPSFWHKLRHLLIGTPLMQMPTKEQMLEAARGASFMQLFKMKVWKRMTSVDGSIKGEFDYIPERTLDELAMIALDLFKEDNKTFHK